MKPWAILILIVLGLLLFSVAIACQKGKATAGNETPRAPVPINGKLTPVMIELFTSEGCSSCPPADEVLARLERTQPVPGTEVIALSEHVDYWNYIGWTDPFSSAAFSARQGDYARAFGNDGVYTPQMVVDGRAELVGSSFSKALSAIAKAAQAHKAAIAVTWQKSPASRAGTISLSVRVTDLSPVRVGDTVEMLLAITESNLSSNVSRGENGGRRLQHTSVVRQLSVIGSANAAEAGALEAGATVKIAGGWRRENLRAVVFLQERAGRRVLGAAAIGLADEN